MFNIRRKLGIAIAVVALVFTGGFLYAKRSAIVARFSNPREQIPEGISYKEIQQQQEISQNKTSPQSTLQKNLPPPNTAILSALNLAVPFTSQAPFGNWDLPYQEACEEASVLMVARFKAGKSITSAQDADIELHKLFDFEVKLFGYYQDTTAQQTLEFASKFYGFEHSRLIYDFTFADVTRELAKGNPLVMPAAGRLLPNPYFHQPGPLYHMLVIRGYTPDGKVITNDPGTKRGEQFIYTQDGLFRAAHDWNGGDVTNGRKVLIVLE